MLFLTLHILYIYHDFYVKYSKKMKCVMLMSTGSYIVIYAREKS